MGDYMGQDEKIAPSDLKFSRKFRMPKYQYLPILANDFQELQSHKNE